MRYFAYGSNMAASEMSAWGPGHRFLGPARLLDRRLELRRRSIRWGGGAADAVPAPGESVWGALYELPDEALEQLDAKEGEGIAYRRRTATVELAGEPLEAVLYEVIDPEPREIAPTPEYAELLLEAAGDRGLPEEYVGELAARLTPGSGVVEQSG